MPEEGVKLRRTGTWKATRTSFTREDADVSQPAGLQGASSGGGALAAERPAWNPLLVQDPDRFRARRAGGTRPGGACLTTHPSSAQATQRPDDGRGDRGHVPAPP